MSKLWCNAHNPKMVEAALDDTLQELDLEYLDLYLIHWPVQFKGDSSDMQKLFPTANNEVQLDDDTSYGLADTWKAMNDLVKTGKVRNVGVSNCTKATLEKLIEKTGLVPAVNQMEYHLRLPEKELIKYCADKGIVWTAYSPLGNNTIGMPLLISDETVKEVAEKHKCDPAQVIIAWCTLDGKTVIPKSVTPKRIESNLLALEACKLDKDDIAKLEGVVGKTGERRFNVPMTYSPRWPINGTFRPPANPSETVVADLLFVQCTTTRLRRTPRTSSGSKSTVI